MIEVRLYQNNDLESVNNILRESFNITKNNFNYNNITEIVACLDNLGKGASGAAIELMNIKIGKEKECSLNI